MLWVTSLQSLQILRPYDHLKSFVLRIDSFDSAKNNFYAFSPLIKGIVAEDFFIEVAGRHWSVSCKFYAALNINTLKMFLFTFGEEVIMKFVAIFATAFISAAALAGADDAASFGKMTYNFNALPLKGNIGKGTKAWSGDYWAFKYGNINLRWNAERKIGYNLPSPGKEQVMKMSEAELAKLAPSEKWSLLKGDYDYHFVHEVGSYTGGRKKLWAGICHGWAPASLHHEGLKVPFGSGDIKGLISYFYADQGEGEAQLGGKCTKGRWIGMGGCGGDVNPGALHVLMANYLGLKSQGFLMDRDPYTEVWNQPVSGFDAKLVSPIRRTHSGFEVDVTANLYWTDEAKPTWNVVYGTDKQKTVAMELAYTLKLDSQMNVVDGSWSSDTMYPDFVWTAPKISEFRGEWAGLEKLLND